MGAVLSALAVKILGVSVAAAGAGWTWTKQHTTTRDWLFASGGAATTAFLQWLFG